jgi:hypothetical protein
VKLNAREGKLICKLALLADEQQAGRLEIRPAKVATVSEVRTPEMARVLRQTGSTDLSGQR